MQPLSDAELRQIYPNLPPARRALYLAPRNTALVEFAITSRWRAGAFLGQIGEESAGLQYLEEIGSGRIYEGRRDLGNTEPGDGQRFKGRSPIMLTGRANYRKYGQLLGLDLENHPEQAAAPEVAFRIAGLYWKLNSLNQTADRLATASTPSARNNVIRMITKRINGGLNGLVSRLVYTERAFAALKNHDFASTPATPAPPETGGDSQPSL